MKDLVRDHIERAIEVLNEKYDEESIKIAIEKMKLAARYLKEDEYKERIEEKIRLLSKMEIKRVGNEIVGISFKGALKLKKEKILELLFWIRSYLY